MNRNNQNSGGNFNNQQQGGRQGGPGGNLTIGKVLGMAAVGLFIMNYFGFAPDLVGGAVRFIGVAILFSMFIMPMFTKSKGGQGRQGGQGNNQQQNNNQQNNNNNQGGGW